MHAPAIATRGLNFANSGSIPACHASNPRNAPNTAKTARPAAAKAKVVLAALPNLAIRRTEPAMVAFITTRPSSRTSVGARCSIYVRNACQSFKSAKEIATKAMVTYISASKPYPIATSFFLSCTIQLPLGVTFRVRRRPQRYQEHDALSLASARAGCYESTSDATNRTSLPWCAVFETSPAISLALPSPKTSISF